MNADMAGREPAVSGRARGAVAWTYTHPIWSRAWSVDAEGIREQRAGVAHKYIGWDELEELTSKYAKSGKGKRISLWLGRRASREFYAHASRLWGERHPERWSRNRRRLVRNGDRAVCLWLPLFVLGPCLAFYLLDWIMGWPDVLSPQREQAKRLSLFGVVSVGLIVCWWCWLRTRKPMEPIAQGQSARPVGGDPPLPQGGDR
jgi:hypothetical protein